MQQLEAGLCQDLNIKLSHSPGWPGRPPAATWAGHALGSSGEIVLGVGEAGLCVGWGHQGASGAAEEGKSTAAPRPGRWEEGRKFLFRRLTWGTRGRALSNIQIPKPLPKH